MVLVLVVIVTILLSALFVLWNAVEPLLKYAHITSRSTTTIGEEAVLYVEDETKASNEEEVEKSELSDKISKDDKDVTSTTIDHKAKIQTEIDPSPVPLPIVEPFKDENIDNTKSSQVPSETVPSALGKAEPTPTPKPSKDENVGLEPSRDIKDLGKDETAPTPTSPTEPSKDENVGLEPSRDLKDLEKAETTSTPILTTEPSKNEHVDLEPSKDKESSAVLPESQLISEPKPNVSSSKDEISSSGSNITLDAVKESIYGIPSVPPGSAKMSKTSTESEPTIVLLKGDDVTSSSKLSTVKIMGSKESNEFFIIPAKTDSTLKDKIDESKSAAGPSKDLNATSDLKSVQHEVNTSTEDTESSKVLLESSEMSSKLTTESQPMIQSAYKDEKAPSDTNAKLSPTKKSIDGTASSSVVPELAEKTSKSTTESETTAPSSKGEKVPSEMDARLSPTKKSIDGTAPSTVVPELAEKTSKSTTESERKVPSSKGKKVPSEMNARLSPTKKSIDGTAPSTVVPELPKKSSKPIKEPETTTPSSKDEKVPSEVTVRLSPTNESIEGTAFSAVVPELGKNTSKSTTKSETTAPSSNDEKVPSEMNAKLSPTKKSIDGTASSIVVPETGQISSTMAVTESEPTVAVVKDKIAPADETLISKEILKLNEISESSNVVPESVPSKVDDEKSPSVVPAPGLVQLSSDLVTAAPITKVLPSKMKPMDVTASSIVLPKPSQIPSKMTGIRSEPTVLSSKDERASSQLGDIEDSIDSTATSVVQKSSKSTIESEPPKAPFSHEDQNASDAIKEPIDGTAPYVPSRDEKSATTPPSEAAQKLSKDERLASGSSLAQNLVTKSDDQQQPPTKPAGKTPSSSTKDKKITSTSQNVIHAKLDDKSSTVQPQINSSSRLVPATTNISPVAKRKSEDIPLSLHSTKKMKTADSKKSSLIELHRTRNTSNLKSTSKLEPDKACESNKQLDKNKASDEVEATESAESYPDLYTLGPVTKFTSDDKQKK